MQVEDECRHEVLVFYVWISEYRIKFESSEIYSYDNACPIITPIHKLCVCKNDAKQKHLGCKKIARPRRSSIVNKSATKSSDIR